MQANRQPAPHCWLVYAGRCQTRVCPTTMMGLAGWLPGLAGASSGSGASEAEQLVAAKLDLRRQQMAAAVGGQPAGSCELQPPPQRAQQDGLQPPAHSTQQLQQQRPGASTPASRSALPPELQRAVAEAQAALAAVGGSSTAANRRSGGAGGQAAAGRPGLPAARPLIKRQPLGAKAAMQQLAGSAACGGTAAMQGRVGSSSAAAAGGQSGATGGSAAEQAAADEDYRARLPDGDSWRHWKAATAQPSDSKGGGSTGPGTSGGGSMAAGAGGADGGQPGRGAEEEEQEQGQEQDREEEEEAQERRSSPIVELSMLLAECVRHGLRTIAFCKSRCEVWSTRVSIGCLLRAGQPQCAESGLSGWRRGALWVGQPQLAKCSSALSQAPLS